MIFGKLCEQKHLITIDTKLYTKSRLAHRTIDILILKEK